MTLRFPPAVAVPAPLPVAFFLYLQREPPRPANGLSTAQGG